LESEAEEEPLTADLVETSEIAARALKDYNPDKETPDERAARLEAMQKMDRNPPPRNTMHDDAVAIGSTMSLEDLIEANKTVRQRAIDKFGRRGLERGSIRFRDNLRKIADVLKKESALVEPALAQYAVPQIEQREDVPFDIGIEDGVFEEIKSATSKK
jgi:hypothetical protein